MKFELVPNWTEKRLICFGCATDKSVKYSTEVKGYTIYFCNKCAAQLKWNGECLDRKYVMSKFSSVKHMKEAIMADQSLTDMEKLKYVFRASKEELKANDPQLYYAILAVLDAAK